jgi:NarL family two-component system sensor histidine kinase LiaS
LQWRLTFSYTLVTVAALIVVELILLGALLVLLNTNFLLNTIVSSLREIVTPQVASYLESDPPDIDGLNLWLSTAIGGNVVDGQSNTRITSGLTIDFDRENESNFVAILDPDTRLLAQSPPPEDPAVLGKSFDASEYPDLADLLPIALSGETEVDRLRVSRPDGALLMVVPVTGRDDTILGLVVMTLALPALNQETLGALSAVILYSVIPFTLAAGMIGTIFGFLTARGLGRRIRTLAHAADAWSQGNFSAVAQDSSGDELGQLSRDLNRMAEQLQNMLQTRQELAMLEERNRLARDLHDSVKQQVFATTMQIAAAKASISSNPEAAQQHLAEAEQLSRQSQQELAGLLQELRPAELTGRGLAAALREFTSDWSRRTHIQAQVKIQGERPLTLHVEQALFRVAQEALANVARHSRAQSAEVQLVWENDHVTLTVSDDGSGFDVNEGEKHGYGTQTMRERMEALNGRLTVRSESGKGTRVIAEATPEAT